MSHLNVSVVTAMNYCQINHVFGVILRSACAINSEMEYLENSAELWWHVCSTCGKKAGERNDDSKTRRL